MLSHTESNDRETDRDHDWRHEAIRKVEADANRSADTHLHVFPLPHDWGITLYLKNESVHPTGSLKHRLARSLFLYALVNGWISRKTTIVEASSGSTARNWSGLRQVGERGYAGAGIQGRPSVSMTRASKNVMSCLAAVDR